MESASVSVVIPVYNGAGTIGRTVECLLGQSLAAAEVIVVDDGSTDGKGAALERYAGRVIYLRKENGGPASARNCGIRRARGDLVAFTDGDCLPDRDWLRQLLTGLDGPRVAGVGGIVRSAEGGLTGEYVDLHGLLDPKKDDGQEISYLVTANACFRRAALIAAGLFDERFRKPGGEEPELCRKLRDLGYEFRLAEGAVVLHHHRQTIKSLLKTIANYGEGLYVLAQIRPEYRVAHPVKTLARWAVAVRGPALRVSRYAGQYGLRRALVFSLLDYLWQPAFLFGYLRGKRHGA
jgi:glycosyltransferase involved in cell wall biosynthesis